MELIMLAGIPTSGKSTYLQKLLEDSYWRSAVILSTDNYIESVAEASGKTYNEVFNQAIKQANVKLSHDLKMALESQAPIIWDQTNLTKRVRLDKMNKIPEWYPRTAVYFEITFEEAMRRNQQRTGKIIPEKVLTSMFSTYEIPTYAEQFDTIKSGNL